MIRFLDLKAVTELHAEEIGRPADECQQISISPNCAKKVPILPHEQQQSRDRTPMFLSRLMLIKVNTFLLLHDLELKLELAYAR